MADPAQPQAPENPDDLPEILRATRDAVFAAERLVLPASVQHGNLSHIPRYQELPHWARAMGCQLFGVPFQPNASGTTYTIRIVGLLTCPMHYSNPAVLAEADQLHLNDRRVLRIRTRVFNADTRAHHLTNTKFVTANGNMRVPSHALWMRVFANWNFRVAELRRGQSHAVLQAANPVSAMFPLFSHPVMRRFAFMFATAGVGQNGFFFVVSAARRGRFAPLSLTSVVSRSDESVPRARGGLHADGAVVVRDDRDGDDGGGPAAGAAAAPALPQHQGPHQQ